jgi:phage-related baseplate assembly protein
MSTLPTPIFVEHDATAIKEEMIAFYEAATGKTLQPAQPEMLVINALAYREFLFRYKVDEAAKQNLVAFANAPILDYLGQLVGVERLAPSNAVCTILFELVDGHGDVVIPVGTLVASVDGRVVFATNVATTVPSGDDSVEIECTAQQSGSIGNGYTAGKISIIQDPQPYLVAASNIGVTTGGGDQETDEQLRDRIKLAPSVFSVAGPRGAYEYWAKSASPQIIDVGVLGQESGVAPGRVEIYPLMETGTTPSGIIQSVFDICDDVKVRPLTDTVIVAAPTPVDYTLTVNLTLLDTAVQSVEAAAASTAANAYVKARRKKLGQDIVRSEIIKTFKTDGIYDVEVVSPSSDIVLSRKEFANNLAININFVGISEA